MSEKEFLKIREVLSVPNMTAPIAGSLTKRSVSCIQMVKRFPTFKEYHDYVVDINERSKTKKENGSATVKTFVTPTYKVTTASEVLERIDAHLVELIDLLKKDQKPVVVKTGTGWLNKWSSI